MTYIQLVMSGIETTETDETKKSVTNLASIEPKKLVLPTGWIWLSLMPIEIDLFRGIEWGLWTQFVLTAAVIFNDKFLIKKL